MTAYVQVMTTTEKKADAQRIARAVVEQRLAGCAQVIGPLTSIFRWKGEIEAREEWLCLMKSRRDVYKELEHAVRELHAYEVPEILAIPVTAGSQRYLTWLGAALGKVRSSGKGIVNRKRVKRRRKPS